IRIASSASITGELSDAFSSKKKGISIIASALVRAISALKELEKENMQLIIEDPLFISVKGKLLELKETVKNYRQISAANWFATAKWMGNYIENGILIDCGSTTTDIIPIIRNEPSAIGKTDLERLKSGELIYTGALRATIPSISHEVPLNGEMVPISFEKFALIADVHLILGNITESQYDCETADGRSKSLENSKKRLARIVCEDASFLGDENIMDIARHLYEKQINIIFDKITKVLHNFEEKYGVTKEDIKCCVTGLGELILAKPAAERAGLVHVKSVSSMLDFNSTIISSSLGTLYMLKEFYDAKNGTGLY
ncbi:MAG: hydantoinase/oxoprolinase family protein, partial [Candidatus Hodarchaeota archaeon]